MTLKLILPDLWQSCAPEARKALEESSAWRSMSMGLRGVICPAYNVRLIYPQDLAALILPVWDNTDLPEGWYDLAIQFYNRFKPVLVHCNGGLNRSSAIAIAILVSRGIVLEEAAKMVNQPPGDPVLMESLRRWARRG
jgi:hypothetical protein